MRACPVRRKFGGDLLHVEVTDLSAPPAYSEPANLGKSRVQMTPDLGYGFSQRLPGHRLDPRQRDVAVDRLDIVRDSHLDPGGAEGVGVERTVVAQGVELGRLDQRRRQALELAPDRRGVGVGLL